MLRLPARSGLCVQHACGPGVARGCAAAHRCDAAEAQGATYAVCMWDCCLNGAEAVMLWCPLCAPRLTAMLCWASSTRPSGTCLSRAREAATRRWSWRTGTSLCTAWGRSRRWRRARCAAALLLVSVPQGVRGCGHCGHLKHVTALFGSCLVPAHTAFVIRRVTSAYVPVQSPRPGCAAWWMLMFAFCAAAATVLALNTPERRRRLRTLCSCSTRPTPPPGLSWW